MPRNDLKEETSEGAGKSRMPWSLSGLGKTPSWDTTNPAKLTEHPISNFFCDKVKWCVRQRCSSAEILILRASRVGA